MNWRHQQYLNKYAAMRKNKPIMYKRNKPAKSTIKRNESYPGESIELKIQRMINNGEPIGEGASIQYTERKDGVNPLMDIRTDRFEIAVEAREKTAKSKIAQREQAIGERSYDTMTAEQQKEFHAKFPGNKFNKGNTTNS